MDRQYLDNIRFPGDAAEYFIGLERKIAGNPALFEKVQNYADELSCCPQCFPTIDDEAKKLGNEAGVPYETMCMMLILLCGENLRLKYADAGIPMDIYRQTMMDASFKTRECIACRGIPGTFVGWWFDGAFAMRRFAIGRFQYEQDTLHEEIPLPSGEKIPFGAPCLQLHIPSSGEPLTDTVRLDSYRKAWEFFRQRDYLYHGLMAVTCSSWLMNIHHREFLPQKSNILRFMDDFTITSFREDKGIFENGWRVFGASWGPDTSDTPRDISALSEDSSLQRAYKRHISSGFKGGEGEGFLVFDGNKILKA